MATEEQRVTLTPGAESQSSTSPFLWKKDAVLRCVMRSGTGLVPSRQAWATLRAVPMSRLDLVPLGWVSSLSQAFPGQIQTILPVGSLPGYKARGWRCLSSILEQQGTIHLSIRHRSTSPPPHRQHPGTAGSAWQARQERRANARRQGRQRRACGERWRGPAGPVALHPVAFASRQAVAAGCAAAGHVWHGVAREVGVRRGAAVAG